MTKINSISKRISNTNFKNANDVADRLLIFKDKQMQTILLKDLDYEINLADSMYQMSDDETQVIVKVKQHVVWIDDQKLIPEKEYLYQKMTFVLLENNIEEYFDIKGRDQLTIGNYPNDNIQLKNDKNVFKVKRKDNKFELLVVSGEIYVNSEKITSNLPILVKPGDELFFNEIFLSINLAFLSIIDTKNSIAKINLGELSKDMVSFPNDYPIYHRSPRIIYRVPDKTVKLNSPESSPSSPDQHIGRILLPPIVMVAMAIIMISFSGSNPVMMISMLGMSVVTVIGSISAYFGGKKSYRINSKARVKKYDNYLSEKTEEVYKLSQEQERALTYHYPSIAEIIKIIHHTNPRIYEKSPFHFDFLSFRMGLGTIDSSFKIDYETDAFSDDQLVKDGAKLQKAYSKIKSVPITADLVHGPVGFVGPRKLVTEQIQEIILQLATFHSYHDVEFLAIFPNDEKENWDWLRWLPHFTLHSMNVRGFIWNERSRDQILNSFYQILKERSQELKENNNDPSKVLFKPHYVVFLMNDELIIDHPIMEYLSKDLTAMGVSLVFIQDVIQSLPEHVNTVIDISDHNNGNIVIKEGKLSKQKFVPDHFPNNTKPKQTVHELAALVHQESLKNSIPKSVTFLQMYGKKHVQDLNIGQRWAVNEPYKSLSVPLGERAPGDIVNLNLHEKADGPHGLLAGTTGAGKSEVIQSYILSLATNFKPSDVGFLLIDYKGGGMANLFKDLPHLLGVITNLDGAQSMRALESIRAELRHRQQLFSKYNVNHINQYQRLFKEGVTDEAIPHLFLISDEFAELKTNQPDFMAELVSTARIGRSLGVHLILATQKPSGVVDDQIWSNSKFKISLKVQDKADSMEILHTPDAATIVEPGRAYLQVGNNEKYELFQTAYSGAEYSPDQENLTTNLPIYSINEMGQYEVLSDDLSDERGQALAEVKKKPTELEAIIQYIKEFAKEHGIKRLPQPWLPPLSKEIVDENGDTFENNWQQELDASVEIGIVDIPSEQAQRPLLFDVNNNSQTAVFASPGFGKSSFIQTIVMQLARKNNPAQINFYLIDFGTNGLAALKNLPHVADLIRIDETEKIEKTIQRLTYEMKKRKKLMNVAGVATLEQYKNATGEELPLIMVAIDNYDAVRDTPFEEKFEIAMTAISREGSSVGITLLISANRHAAIRMQMAANLKTQYALHLNDQTENSDIVGRTRLKVEEIPGRGLVKLKDVQVFQTYQAAAGKDGLAIINNVRKEAEEMDSSWSGARPLAIPMVAEEYSYDDFIMRQDVLEAENNGIPLALKLSDTKPVSFDFRKDNLFALIYENSNQHESYLKSSISGMFKLINNYETIIFGNEEDVDNYDDQFDEVVDSADYEEIAKRLVSVIAERQAGKQQVEKETVIMIRDFKQFSANSNLTDDEVQTLLTDSRKQGMHVIFGIGRSELESGFTTQDNLLRSETDTGIMGSRMTDQSFITTNKFISNEAFLTEKEGYYFKERDYTKVRFPTFESII